MCWLVWVVGFAWHGYVVVVLVIVVVVVLVVVVGVVVVAVALVFNSRQRQISSSRQDTKKRMFHNEQSQEECRIQQLWVLYRFVAFWGTF